jgi:uncharacterized damage-inducible protein DinB
MAVDHARMDAAHRVARATLESGRQTFLDNVTGISLEEALDAGGGFRSILGLTKHTAAWTAVYLDEARPVYWGDVWPLRQIVAYTATHWAYHAGEINVIIANRRRKAWEYDEHVEENHILTIGHSVRRPWVTDEQVERADKEMRRAATGSVPGSRTASLRSADTHDRLALDI